MACGTLSEDSSDFPSNEACAVVGGVTVRNDLRFKKRSFALDFLGHVFGRYDTILVETRKQNTRKGWRTGLHLLVRLRSGVWGAHPREGPQMNIWSQEDFRIKVGLHRV